MNHLNYYQHVETLTHDKNTLFTVIYAVHTGLHPTLTSSSLTTSLHTAYRQRLEQ